MREIIEPVYTAMINDVPVRFFKAPGADPHLPWHSVDDLHKAMKLPHHVQQQLLQRTATMLGGKIKRVESLDGQVVIASHSVAQGLIASAIEAHGFSQVFERDYARASAEAMNTVSGELSGMETLRLTIAAARNSLRDGL